VKARTKKRDRVTGVNGEKKETIREGESNKKKSAKKMPKLTIDNERCTGIVKTVVIYRI